MLKTRTKLCSDNKDSAEVLFPNTTNDYMYMCVFDNKPLDHSQGCRMLSSIIDSSLMHVCVLSSSFLGVARLPWEMGKNDSTWYKSLS